MVRKVPCCNLADVANAEGINEALERHLAPRGNGIEELAHGNLTVAFQLLELYGPVAHFQRKDIGRFLDPALRKEELDLLLAKPVDVERAPRGEMLEVLHLLVRA